MLWARCPDGSYLPGTWPALDGINVFKANDIIVEMLRESGALLHVEKMQHSYPCCWRHKSPIIFRATSQWFVSMDQKGLRAQSLKEIKGVQWIPDWGQARIESMVANCPGSVSPVSAPGACRCRCSCIKKPTNCTRVPLS